MINLVSMPAYNGCGSCVHTKNFADCAGASPCKGGVFKETGASTLTEPSAKWNGTLTLSK